MKKSILIFLLVISSNKIIIGQAWEQSVIPALNSILEYSEKRSSYSFERNHSSLTGAFLGENEEIAYYFQTSPLNDYLFISGDDEYYSSPDLYLEDEDGDIIKSGKIDNEIIFIEFTPKKFGSATLRIVNSKSKGTVFCAVATLIKTNKDNGSKLKFKEAIENADRFGRSFPENYYFLGEGNFCLIGGLTGLNHEDGMFNIQPNYSDYSYSKYYSLAVAGSYNVYDIDAEIIRQSFIGSTKNGITSCEDNSYDKNAIATCKLYPNQYYYFKYKNSASDDDGFLIGWIFYRY